MFNSKVHTFSKYLYIHVYMHIGFPGSSDSKESACNAGNSGLIPRLGRSPGEENGYPCQYSCLENPMDRRAWRATVHGVAKIVHVCVCIYIYIYTHTYIDVYIYLILSTMSSFPFLFVVNFFLILYWNIAD